MTSEWQKAKLDDVLIVKRGQTITKKDAQEGPYPVILGGKEPAYYIDKFNHTGKAIVISRSGASAGYVSFWNQPIFVTDGFLLEPKDGISYEFLYYLLKSKQFELNHSQRGAAIPHVTPALIQSINIVLPPSDVKEQIASILAAYDSLIENNQKRIKLLEQIAENLFKEWFVRFRFPGYENAEFERGEPKGWNSLAGDNRIPQGWAYGELKQLGTFNRGKNITSAEMVEGIVPVISAGLEPSGYHNQSNVNGPCLTISSSGANAGYLKYNLTDIWAADCSYYNKPDNIWFVYSSLKYLQPVISNLQCGAAQPHVYPKDVNRLCVILPPKYLIQEYNKQCQAIFESIYNLINQISILTHQRDLLLPRLMSGKLSI